MKLNLSLLFLTLNCSGFLMAMDMPTGVATATSLASTPTPAEPEISLPIQHVLDIIDTITKSDVQQIKNTLLSFIEFLGKKIIILPQDTQKVIWNDQAILALLLSGIQDKTNAITATKNYIIETGKQLDPLFIAYAKNTLQSTVPGFTADEIEKEFQDLQMSASGIIAPTAYPLGKILAIMDKLTKKNVDLIVKKLRDFVYYLNSKISTLSPTDQNNIWDKKEILKIILQNSTNKLRSINAAANYLLRIQKQNNPEYVNFAISLISENRQLGRGEVMQAFPTLGINVDELIRGLGFSDLFYYPDLLKKALEKGDIKNLNDLTDSRVVGVYETYGRVTLLQAANFKNNDELISLLLQYGADPRVKGNVGTTSPFEKVKNQLTSVTKPEEKRKLQQRLGKFEKAIESIAKKEFESLKLSDEFWKNAYEISDPSLAQTYTYEARKQRLEGEVKRSLNPQEEKIFKFMFFARKKLHENMNLSPEESAAYSLGRLAKSKLTQAGPAAAPTAASAAAPPAPARAPVPAPAEEID